MLFVYVFGLVTIILPVVELQFDDRLQHLEELFKFLVTGKLASAEMRNADFSSLQVL